MTLIHLELLHDYVQLLYQYYLQNFYLFYVYEINYI